MAFPMYPMPETLGEVPDWLRRCVAGEGRSVFVQAAVNQMAAVLDSELIMKAHEEAQAAAPVLSEGEQWDQAFRRFDVNNGLTPDPVIPTEPDPAMELPRPSGEPYRPGVQLVAQLVGQLLGALTDPPAPGEAVERCSARWVTSPTSEGQNDAHQVLCEQAAGHVGPHTNDEQGTRQLWGP